MINFLVSWTKEVIHKNVPLPKLTLFCVPWWSDKIGELVEEAREALKRHRRIPEGLSWQEYIQPNRARGAAIRQVKRWGFQEAI